MYSSREAAKILGLSHESMRKFAQRYGAGQKVGRDWIFADKDLKIIREHSARGPGPVPKKRRKK